MAIKIEEAFNDCFERLLFGESLDSCLRSYPEHAAELDIMLRVAYDVKRRAYPIQPRPEFKYWSRVRLQGVQDYMSRHAAPEKASPFNFRKNLAISVAGLLVLVIASSGTAAASNDAMPDQPLYGVKMAVEQTQLALAVSDVDKAMLYASLAEKRALEIEAMARQGKADYLISTSTKMDYQLGQAETYISKYQAANTTSSATTTEALPAETTSAENPDQAGQTTTEVLPAATSTADNPDQTVQTTQIVPTPTTQEKPTITTSDNKSGVAQPVVKQPLLTPRGAANVSKAKTALNSSTAKSLATLQDALKKAPESARPAIIKTIERVKKANTWSQKNLNADQGQDDKPEIIIPKPNTFPVKPLPDTNKTNRDNGNFVTPDKPKYIPRLNNSLSNPTTDTVKPSVNVLDSQGQVPASTVIPRTSDTGSTQTPVITNTINTVTSPVTGGSSGDSSTIKVFSK